MKKKNTILLYPVSTEKAIKMMEIENKIIFVVDMRASKTEIINAFQEEFKKVISGWGHL